MKQLNILFGLPKAIPQTVHPDQKLTASTGVSTLELVVVGSKNSAELKTP